MKSINKIVYNNVKTILETTYFKACLVLMIIFSIYGGYLSAKQNYIEGFISVLSFPMFFVFGVLMPFLVISFCAYSLFDKNVFLIGRLKGKKEYIKVFIFTIFYVNLISFIIMIITLIISLNLFPKTGLGFKYNQLLNCHNFVYLIFVIFRLFCIVECLSISSMLLCKVINPKIIIGLNIVLYGSLIGCYYLNTFPIDSIINIPIYIGNYLIISHYASFGIELICTTIYLTILVLISFIIFKVVNKKIKDISV